MVKPVDLTTHQFKTELIRKLKNIAPTCEVEFIDNLKTGIGFRLKDTQHRYRSNIVRFSRYREDLLGKDSLVSAIKNAGVPEAGLPHGLVD